MEIMLTYPSYSKILHLMHACVVFFLDIFLNFLFKQIFQQLLNDVLLKMNSYIRGGDLKMLHVERRAGDESAVAGASILASLSNLRSDLSNLRPPVSTAPKTYLGTEIRHPNHDTDEIDGLEVNSATHTGNDSACEIGASSKSTPLGSSPDPSTIDTGKVNRVFD